MDLNPHPLKCTKGAAPAVVGVVWAWVTLSSKPRGLGDRGYRMRAIMMAVFPVRYSDGSRTQAGMVVPQNLLVADVFPVLVVEAD